MVGQAKAGPISYGGSPSGGGTPYFGNDPSFFLSYSDASGNIATATLDAVDLGNGTFLATSGVLVVTGGADVGTYSLFPGGPNPTFSPSGAFIFNNVLYPNTNPSLDPFGLLFTGNGLEINIWGNSPNNFSFWSWNGRTYNVSFDGGFATLTAIPEPSSLALFGMVTCTLASYCGWRRRNQAVTA